MLTLDLHKFKALTMVFGDKWPNLLCLVGESSSILAKLAFGTKWGSLYGSMIKFSFLGQTLIWEIDSTSTVNFQYWALCLDIVECIQNLKGIDIRVPSCLKCEGEVMRCSLPSWRLNRDSWIIGLFDPYLYGSLGSSILQSHAIVGLLHATGNDMHFCFVKRS